ncbi:phosphate ABC transporter permease PstA [Oscillibacter sp. GMB15532]|uniref:phosphate ABC transporter permease PstA n=1 Tax=Oscillibacter sp. GMB15532 TaxID=3230022 RepID=UPI0034DEC0F1
MKCKAFLVRSWAYLSMALVAAVILFLFGYVFVQGGPVITWEFFTASPSGSVLGSEGGIWPAIAGSLCFTATAVVLGGIPAIATALYLVFFCQSKLLRTVIQMVIQNIAGIPSIVLGLFAYSLLVRALGLGRCVLSAGVALAIMILPFIEVRAEKAFRELPPALTQSAYALGCSKSYTIWKIVLPACRGELVSGVILGACYAMGATAPLMFTGGVAYAAMPVSLTKPAMALPLHLYLLLAQGTSIPQAYGTAFVLMMVVLLSNFLAALYAKRRNRAWKQS